MKRMLSRFALTFIAAAAVISCNAVIRGGPLSSVPFDNHGIFITTGGSPTRYKTLGFVQIRGYGVAIAGLANVGDAQLDGTIRGALATEASKMGGTGVINIEFEDENPQTDYDKGQQAFNSFRRGGGGIQTSNRYVTVTGEVVQFTDAMPKGFENASDGAGAATPPPVAPIAPAGVATAAPPQNPTAQNPTPPSGSLVTPPGTSAATTAPTVAPPSNVTPSSPPPVQQPQPATQRDPNLWPAGVAVADRTQCTFRCVKGGVPVDDELEKQLAEAVSRQLGAALSCSIQTGGAKMISYEVQWGPDGSMSFAIDSNNARHSMRECLARIPAPRQFRGRPNQAWKCSDYCQ